MLNPTTRESRKEYLEANSYIQTNKIYCGMRPLTRLKTEYKFH